MRLRRGDRWRMRIADVPVVVRKARKCGLCRITRGLGSRHWIEVGALYGAIDVRKRENGETRYRTDRICAECMDRWCEFVEPHVETRARGFDFPAHDDLPF